MAKKFACKLFSTKEIQMRLRLLLLVIPLLLIASVASAAQFAITTSHNSGGTVTPLKGKNLVEQNGSLDVTFTANDGFYLAQVTVDKLPVPLTSRQSLTYSFTKVDRKHAIAAKFVKNPVITAKGSSGGTVTPNGKIFVPYSTGKSFTFAPAEGYHLESVTADRVNVGTPETYTFNAVKTNRSLSAKFAPNTYAVTTSAGDGGVITPAGLPAVKHGQVKTFKIIPDKGMRIATLAVNGEAVTGLPEAGPYTLQRAITTDTTITATFTSTALKVVVPTAVIKIDGNIADWNGISPILTTPPHGSDYSGLDITDVYMAHDSKNIYFRADRVGNSLPPNEYSNFWFYLRPSSPGKKGYAFEFFHLDTVPPIYDARLWDISADPGNYGSFVQITNNYPNILGVTTIEWSIPKNLIVVENEFSLSFFTHHTVNKQWQQNGKSNDSDVTVTFEVPPPIQSLAGTTWIDTLAPVDKPFSLTFLDASSYVLITADPADNGVERGTYTWNPTTGSFMVTGIIFDTVTGNEGFSNDVGYPNTKAAVYGNTLTIFDPTSGDSGTLTRLNSQTGSLTGAWGDVNSIGAEVIFLDGSRYLFANLNPGTDAYGTAGIESGTYSWNPESGAFTASAALDTNGEWGLSHPSGPVTTTVSGDVLKFNVTGEGTFSFPRIK
jgi:hypothetical protein